MIFNQMGSKIRANLFQILSLKSAISGRIRLSFDVILAEVTEEPNGCQSVAHGDL